MSRCICITIKRRRETFTQKICEYCRRLTQDHGLLRQQDGRTVFGFIHGNWALDNSRPDGKWCGLNGEIALLRELGCYADFTMPSIPSPTQGRIVNQIYWCTNNPDNQPRSFDRGVEATAGGGQPGRSSDDYRPRSDAPWRQSLCRALKQVRLPATICRPPTRVRQWFDVAPSRRRRSLH